MNKHLQRKNSRRGFTLIETMLSLMITSFAILLMGWTISDVRQSNYHNDITQFYLYMNIVENQNYKFKSVYPKRLVLKKNRKVYYVKPYKDQLIMTTHAGGYMPLLYHVRDVEWHRTNDGLIDQHVTMQNGQQFDGKSRFNE